MTLRSRLGAGLVTIAIILVLPLVFAIQSLHRLHEDAQSLRDHEFVAQGLVGRIREGLNNLRHEELGLLFTNNVAARDTVDRELAHLGALADSLHSYQLPKYAEDIGVVVRQIAIAAPSEYRASLAGDTARADALSRNVFVPALNRADSTANFAERALRDRTIEVVAQQSTSIGRTTTLSVTVLVLGLIIAAVIAIWLTRSISAPILDLRAGMSAVADGDLGYKLRIPPDRDDEFGTLAESFKEMTRQLAELDKLKAEFVSVASHELKTPINVMVGYLQLLDEGIYGPLTRQQLDVHKTLVVQANTLLRLVKQLLDVSRFEAGGGRLEPRRINLDRFLSELFDAFHVLAVQREIKFDVDRGSDLPDEVYWDEDRINEVLGNLLSNAFKFTPRGGRVELRIDAIEGGIEMEVRDTGAGIPPEQLPRIFEKFYQADNQHSAHATGTGLGLAIAKQIVETHGGSIACDSTVGVGTTFTITLPIRVTRRSSVQRAATPVTAAV
jgi:signal transduction histidine kinase